MQSKRRILVTGGAGFLGTALVRQLAEGGAFVRVLDNGFRSAPPCLKGHTEWVQADIRDAAAVFHATEGMDSVIHLAAVNGTEWFYKDPALVLDVGVRGMLNVLDGCKRAHVQDLLVASSSEVYQTPPSVPTSENAPLGIPDVLNPRYSYGGSKILSELLAIHCEVFHRAVIFRPHNVYGPAMGKEHVIPQFIRRMHRLNEQTPQGVLSFPIQGSGTETRSFIHIDDFVQGLLLLLERGEHRTIYHIGNPEEISMATLAYKIARHFGREIHLQPGPLQRGSTPRRCPDIGRMSQLGFAPSIPLDEGLPSVISWYLEHV